jgi:hypothetical protein
MDGYTPDLADPVQLHLLHTFAFGCQAMRPGFWTNFSTKFRGVQLKVTDHVILCQEVEGLALIEYMFVNWYIELDFECSGLFLEKRMAF